MTPDPRARTAVITISHQRDGHLHRQRLGLADGPPTIHVVVGMNDTPRLPPITGAPTPVRSQLAANRSGLPLAQARNVGARVAIDEGATTLIFLDVDCIPAPTLVARYARAAAVQRELALLCGPVAYLPPPEAGGYPRSGLHTLAPFHPSRPVPADHELRREDRFELFWSLSFCVTAATWDRLGGFHEGYHGYGAEDTDFAMAAKDAGAALFWVGGAAAFHQHHPPSRDAPEHLAELVNNSRLFHDRHGWWPMDNWLTQLAAEGKIVFDPDAGEIRLRPGRLDRRHQADAWPGVVAQAQTAV